MIGRLSLTGLTRAAALGAVVAGSLASTGAAMAAPGDPVALDHQLAEHLGPAGQAAFQFQYGGTGDLAQIVVLPTGGLASQLAVRVLGPDRQPVELYDGGSTSAAIKDEVVAGPAGTYTVEVTNQDGQSAADFAISEQETPIATSGEGSSDQSGDATDSSAGE